MSLALVEKFSGVLSSAARSLVIHEYQAKGLLRDHGVKTLPGEVCWTPEEVVTVCEDLHANQGVNRFVVKSQIHAGGRGIGTFTDGFQGGVHLCDTPMEAKELAAHMINNTLVTKQTPPEGRLVRRVFIEGAADIERELYFSILMDRNSRGPMVVASVCGGVDIESVAHETPEMIITMPIDIDEGMTIEQAGELAKQLGFDRQPQQATEQILALYETFRSTDATQVEINPLAELKDGSAASLDAKLNFDANAEFRQEEVFAMRDMAEENWREIEATKFGLNYIGLDGNVGCLVNGAGLAMATLDVLKLNGAEPANFMDTAGAITIDKVCQALEIIMSDENVEVLLINVFGGIVSCKILAEGILKFNETKGLNIPLVVRMEGTHVEAGKALLEASPIEYYKADNLKEACEKAAQLSKK
ncbi:succinyl-CoA synthetase, beta subunit [Kipferlia bialata]|uniref:Succinate--CoA ligase [ADP-forming] subunit beta, mitochondrial n=1 Tax=Kipferlia bialata TaxID=797122 RepID=A0A9K3GGP3_9EUKA|nr:succinyl-CoA synthetase, beta subunit [Kipferlia bialata]|eukprot:g4595.t1